MNKQIIYNLKYTHNHEKTNFFLQWHTKRDAYLKRGSYQFGQHFINKLFEDSTKKFFQH